MVPNARKASVVSKGNNSFDVRIDERAERGRANRRLLEVMSEYLGVPKSKLVLAGGARSRDKTIIVVP